MSALLWPTFRWGGRASLIHYFLKDTATLLVAAAESLCVKFSATLIEIAQHGGASPEERIRARIASLLDQKIEQPVFNRLMIENLPGSDTAAARKLM